MAFGIQRCVVGTVASIPVAISAALHDAIACTVDKWLCTKNHLGTVTSAQPGFHSHHVRQYGREVRHPHHGGSGEQAASAWASSELLPHSVRGRRGRCLNRHGGLPYFRVR